MSIKSFIAKRVAKYYASRVQKWKNDPFEYQQRVFEHNLAVGKETAYGRDHGLDKVTDYEGFKKAIPLRDYEAFRPYVDRILEGEENVLWKGTPKYMAKTSGTTSGIKYIPVSEEGMPTFINAGRIALAMYVNETGNASWVDGGLIFIQGSPELQQVKKVQAGRMSGITYHHIPSYFRKNLTPTYETNTIEDWETKVEKICEETLQKDMTVIGGIPPWVLMYFEQLIQKTGKKTVGEIFPNFQVYVYGGVNFVPYKDQFRQAIGRDIAYIETYNASEGFIAFQDEQGVEGMLLNVDGGIFYEFVPAEEIHIENPTRLQLKDVQVGPNYAIILNSNSGLWGYIIGDTVRFVSTNPYRVVVTGRTKHFISAFGEHVIGEEVEEAIQEVAAKEKVGIIEFTVAPQVNPAVGELPYHEWFVEFAESPSDMKAFSKQVDDILCDKNIYYKDLIEGAMLQPLVIRSVPKDGFRNYMKSKGKLGGQNKMPRLANDRKYADELISVLGLEV